jgi:hypothetical protein
MPFDACCRFVLSWSGHLGELRLPAGAGNDAVEAALALGPALPALAALEQWIGQALEAIEPGTVPAAADTLALSLTLPGAAPATLHLPVAALPFGRPPPAALPLAWPELVAQVVVQTLPPQALDPAALRDGALLLLPQAFDTAAGWPVELHADRVGWPPLQLSGLPGWRPTTGSKQPGAPAEPADADAWQIVLAEAARPNAAAWFGAAGVAPSGFGGATLQRAGRRWAGGAFVPAGAGWALRLTAA